MNRRTTSGFLMCGLAMVTVGSTVVASNLIAAGLPPFTATALRFALGSPIFLVLMVATRTPRPHPDRRDSLLLLVQAALGSVGYTVLLLLGLKFTDAAGAGVATGTLTAVTALLSAVLLRERLMPTQIGAVLLASVGVFAVTGLGEQGFRYEATALLGNALVLGAVGCEALFLLLNKRLRVPLSPLAQSAAMTGLGLLVALPFVLLERPWAASIDTTAVLAVAYYALVPTVIGFLLWYAGSARLTGVQASLATAILPISAVLLAAIVLGENIGVAEFIGVACVLGAVLLGSRGQSTRKADA